VNGLWVQGQFAEAEASAKSAKKWVIWSIVIWAIGIALYIALIASGVIPMDVDTTTS
jgi:hypothetical protein